MKTMHKICANFTKKEAEKLKEFKILVNAGQVDCIIIEENETYFEIKKHLEKNIIDFKGVVFEKKEVINSDFSIISNYSPAGGYPMPDNLEYQIITFNTDNWCQTCGTGLSQNNPFYLKQVPNLKKKIFGLIWISDELFVEIEYYNEIFKPLGIKSRNVILYKNKCVIESIVQLIIPTIDENLDLNGYSHESCLKCNRKKYSSTPLNFFPIQQNPLPHIYKSKEYFGSDSAANKKIFISKQLRNRLINDKNMLWNWFVPCLK